MGADMLIAAVAIKKGQKPNWEAGQRWIESLTGNQKRIDEVISYIEAEGSMDLSYESLRNGTNIYIEDDSTGNEVLDVELFMRWLHELLDQFRGALINSRTVTRIHVRDLILYASGGLSYGDAPTEEAEQFWRIGAIGDSGGSLLGTLGFVVDYDEPEVAVTPEEEAAAVESIKRVTA